MGRKLKRINLWLRRQSQLPVFLTGAAVVLLLFFNDETSITRSREYDNEITALNARIEQARDSAEYYRQERLKLETTTEDLERVAREVYHMQRPSEDVYIIE